jgi:alkylation response protein AidB-like acyl-CoA dehydrogenase
MAPDGDHPQSGQVFPAARIRRCGFVNIGSSHAISVRNRASRRAFDGMASNVDRKLDSDMLVAALLRERPAIQQASWRPEVIDRFPVDAMNILRKMGLVAAPLPMLEGGLGWGTEEAGIAALCSVLQILGYGNLPLGRIYEAHVNAIALIFRYGGAGVRATAAAASFSDYG